MNSYDYEKARDQRLAESICVAAVVRVLKFDSAKMTVNVQPLSKRLQNGKYESQPPILGVPVAVTRSGGFILRPWIKEGDVGVVVYLDHDLDSTVAAGKEAEPHTTRNHDASDAIFVGGIVSGSYSADKLPKDCLVLASEDGSTYIAVGKGGIEIHGSVTVSGTVTAYGDVLSNGSISGAHHTHPGDSGGRTGQPG